MSCLTPPRPPLRIIKITSDEPSIFITHRDPTKTPKHPRLSLPPSSPYTAPSASSSSPSHHLFFKTSTSYASPARKGKERSDSVVCLSSPVHSGPSKTRPGSAAKSGKAPRGQSPPYRIPPSHRSGNMDDSDDDGIPPLHEALRMSSGGTSSRSRMISEDVQDLRETARTWIEEDNRLSARKKDKLTRAARLVELQSRRRRPLVSPSPSPLPAAVSPLVRARARESSVGMVDTSDSVTQPTTPYDAPQQRYRNNQRPRWWSRSPVLSPEVDTKRPQDELWTRHETPYFPKDGFYEQPREEQDDCKDERTATSAAKGKGRATLADLFVDDEAEEEETSRRPSPARSMQGVVMAGDDNEGAVEDEIDELDDDQVDELAKDIPAGGEYNIEAGGDRGESDEYDDQDLDYALAELDPDSFSTSAPGSSRSKAIGSIYHNVDADSEFVEPLDAGFAQPPTQYDITGVDFFTDDYDLPLLAPHKDDDDDDTIDSGGIISPIVLIHEMEEKYREFFNEHWRRGADGAKRQYNQPDAEGSGSRTSGTKGKARAGAATGAARKKFWATRGRGRARGRARGGARRK